MSFINLIIHVYLTSHSQSKFLDFLTYLIFSNTMTSLTITYVENELENVVGQTSTISLAQRNHLSICSFRTDLNDNICEPSIWRQFVGVLVLLLLLFYWKGAGHHGHQRYIVISYIYISNSFFLSIFLPHTKEGQEDGSGRRRNRGSVNLVWLAYIKATIVSLWKLARSDHFYHYCCTLYCVWILSVRCDQAFTLTLFSHCVCSTGNQQMLL